MKTAISETASASAIGRRETIAKQLKRNIMETDMTREEAIKVLEQIRQWTDYPKEALTMAIEALSKPKLPSNLDEAAKAEG